MSGYCLWGDKTVRTGTVLHLLRGIAPMERFVQRIVAGGLALVAGLWTLALGDGTATLVGGGGLAVAGLVALGSGIATPLDPAW